MEGRDPIDAVISRSVNGINLYSWDYEGYPDVSGYVRSANKFGATTTYHITALSKNAKAVNDGAGWYLTEAWTAESPWPSEKLDPAFGDSLLSELVIPHVFDGQYTDANFASTRPPRVDAYAERRAQVTAAKARRLAHEKAVPH